MIQINLASLVKHLNPFSRQALEAAAAECMSQQASEITVAHVLLQMLASVRSDLRVISERADIDLNELRRALTVENYATSRTADNYPAFSPMLVEWLKEGAAGLRRDAAQRTAWRCTAAGPAAFTTALCPRRGRTSADRH